MAFNIVLLFTLNAPVPSTRQIQAGLTPIMEGRLLKMKTFGQVLWGFFEKRGAVANGIATWLNDG
jgi:hypothetical protein